MIQIGNTIVKNEYVEYDDRIELIITGSKHGDFKTVFDIEDYSEIKNYKWLVNRFRGSKTYSNYYIISSKGKFLHRILLKEPKGKTIDHIDGDSMNNRKSNLRICTIRENSKNNKIHKYNKSGHKGVLWYYYRNVNKWMAYICIDNKRTTLGYFEDYDEACKVREDAEKELFGEFNREKQNL